MQSIPTSTTMQPSSVLPTRQASPTMPPIGIIPDMRDGPGMPPIIIPVDKMPPDDVEALESIVSDMLTDDSMTALWSVTARDEAKPTTSNDIPFFGGYDYWQGGPWPVADIKGRRNVPRTAQECSTVTVTTIPEWCQTWTVPVSETVYTTTTATITASTSTSMIPEFPCDTTTASASTPTQSVLTQVSTEPSTQPGTSKSMTNTASTPVIGSSTSMASSMGTSVSSQSSSMASSSSSVSSSKSSSSSMAKSSTSSFNMPTPSVTAPPESKAHGKKLGVAVLGLVVLSALMAI